MTEPTRQSWTFSRVSLPWQARTAVPSTMSAKLDPGLSTRKSSMGQTSKRELGGLAVSSALPETQTNSNVRPSHRECSAHPCVSTKRTRRHGRNLLLTSNAERRICGMLKHDWVPNVSRMPTLIERYSSKLVPPSSPPCHQIAPATC